MKRTRKQVVINWDWCKKCGICVAFCPKGAIVLGHGDLPCWHRPDKCVNCGLCELRCPDLAIELA
jgi:2-oxoglutarate ferredoxin oxidoreductase subunit delta